MKVKYIFEPSDFDGRGQRIIRNSASASTSGASKSTVAYMVGFIRNDELDGPVMISMADGMVIFYQSLVALCDHLNNDQHGYRPMTDADPADVSAAVGNRFKK